MANDLSVLLPKILTRGLDVLRENIVMPRLVNANYSNVGAQKGSSIVIPKSTAVGTHDVTPAVSDPTPTDSTPDEVTITLDNWKETNHIYLTDQELEEIDRSESFLPQQLGEGIRTLCNDINESVFSEYKGVYGTVGTAGTTPWGSGVGVQSATEARKILNQQLSPRDMRRIVMDDAAEAAALSLAEFSNVDKSGTAEALVRGNLGQKFGFDMYSQTYIPTHTAGTLTGDPVVTGANAVGATSIGLTCDSDDVIALLEGDIITFAGDTQTYVVGANLAIANSATGSVAIQPALKVATTGSEAVTVKGDHTVNMAFHKDAFALVMRPLNESRSLGNQIGGSMSSYIIDPVTGVPLRLEISNQHKQIAWSFDCLWGVKLIRPELACRILG